MGDIHIISFDAAHNRRTAICGEEFEVELAVTSIPLTEGAVDEIALSVADPGYEVEPRVVRAQVEPLESRVTKVIRMCIRGPATAPLEVTACGRTSADSFTIRILVPR